MSAETIARTVAAAQGWNDTTLLNLTQNYIDNQQSPDTLADYLRTVAEGENVGDDEVTDARLTGSSDDIIAAQGWNDDTVLDLLFTYIDNQQSNDAFSDYVREVAEEENGGPVCEICHEKTDRKDRHGTLMCEDCDEDEDEFPYVCDNCGNDISDLGWDRTGSRRCDDTDPKHRYHAALADGAGDPMVKVLI